MFSVSEISFFGFILTTEGVKKEPNRLSTILEWPEPTTHQEIQFFLKFANFYRRFIIEFSRIVGGLTGIVITWARGRSRDQLDR